jgi:hypothetical protein
MLPSGSYDLYIFDNDGCNYYFNYEITSSTQITYTASIIIVSSFETSTIDITNVTGGTNEYNYFITTTSLSEYTGSI